jgi:dipeptidyl aminopeptidase/acylaminoacyl peptidase
MQPRLARTVIRILAIGIIALPLAASRAAAPATQGQPKTRRALTLENITGGGGRGGARGATISPDGRFVALATNSPAEAATYLWSPSTDNRTFWFQGSIAAWFPDSQRAVISRESDLWSLPVGSTDAKQITTDGKDKRAIVVSPDGKWVAFSSVRGGANDIWIVSADGGAAPRQLTQNAMPLDDARFGPAWSPDSKTIAYISNKGEYWHDDVWLLDVASGRTRQLSKSLMAASTPAWSADGKTIALLGNAKKGFWYEDLQDIWLLDPAKGTERTVKMQIYATDQLHSQPVFWSGDSSHLFFVYHERGDINLWTVPASGGVATRLTNERGTMRGIETDAKGDAFVYVRTTPTSGGEVEYLPGIGGPPRQLTDGSVEWENVFEPQEVAYRSFDGLYIQGFLYLPQNMTPGKKYPALVNVHGGGTNSYWRGQNLMENYLASKGYVVVAINYRGGSGFGREFQDLSINDWANGQAHDAAMAADFLRSLPYVNGKVGIYGYSYGGIMSMATIARYPDKFDAAVPMAGIYDFADAYTNADRLGKIFIRTGHGGAPDARKEIYDISNTLARVRNIKTPLLVMHGEADVRAPFHQFEMVVKILTELHKTFESKTYPGEPHGFRNPANRLDMNRRLEAFLDKYLKGGQPPTHQ